MRSRLTSSNYNIFTVHHQFNNRNFNIFKVVSAGMFDAASVSFAEKRKNAQGQRGQPVEWCCSGVVQWPHLVVKEDRCSLALY